MAVWDRAQSIAQPLTAYWEARGLYAEADAWTDRVRLAIEDANGAAPALDSPAGDLWRYSTSARATRQLITGHLDIAEKTYHEIVAMAQASPSSRKQQNSLAVHYFQLGRIAQDRGRLDKATDWFRRALAINEELGDQTGKAIATIS